MINTFLKKSFIEHEESILTQLNLGGIGVLMNKNNTETWVHTIGNTTRRLPELLLFCENNKINESIFFLEDFSEFMYRTNAVPGPGRIMTFKRKKYHPVIVDRPFFDKYIKRVLVFYAYSPAISLIQLLSEDYTEGRSFKTRAGTMAFEYPQLKYH